MGNAQQRRIFVKSLTVKRPVLPIFALLFTGAAFAQLPEPRLTVLSSCGGRVGETVVISATGIDLEDSELRFSSPGFVAKKDAKDSQKWSVEVGPELLAGRYDVRLAGKYGVSNPRRFEVSNLPEADLSQKATSKETAQELSFPLVIRGVVPKQGVLWFKIQGMQGKPLLLDCHAGALDSRLEPALTLLDANGRELTRVRNKPLQWTPDSDAPFFVTLRDFINNGGNEYFFRLYAGAPEALPPAVAVNGPLFWPLSQQSKAGDTPNEAGKPKEVSLPLETSGEFYPARHADRFEFEAKKGDVWWMEIFSHRLGCPTHPRLLVERLVADKDGKQTPQDALVFDDAPFFSGDPDFNGQHFDPTGRFEAKEDGHYRLTVRDQNNTSEAAHGRRYKLSVRKASPDFALVSAVLPSTPNKAFKDFTGATIQVRAANIRPGQVLPVRVLTARRDGFDGSIVIGAEGLPPGVTADSTVIGPKQNEGVLLLRATESAAAWIGAIQVTGRSTIGGSECKHTALCSTPVWESSVGEFVEPPRSRIAAELALAVVADAPLSDTLQVESDALEGLPTDKLKVRLKVAHSGGEPVPVKVKSMGLAGMEKAKETEIPAKEATVEYELDLGPLKLAPGTYSVWFRGEEKVKRDVKGKTADVTLVLCSNPLRLTIKEAPKK